MHVLARRLLAALSLSLLVACAGQAPEPTTPDDATTTTTAQEDPAVGPVDGVACVGTVDPVPEGLLPADDSALLDKALGETDAGSLCEGQVFEVSVSVTVYRVWNSAKDYTERGSWWAFEHPGSSREAYREANAVCEEWSPLDRLVVCELSVGAHVVVGPGQSAACEEGRSYEKSATNQVFVPNDTRTDDMYVENCQPSVEWP